MNTDPEEKVERDQLAPIERLHIIAELFAEGIRRQRAGACRIGEIAQHQEREGEGLELSELGRLDRPLV